MSTLGVYFDEPAATLPLGGRWLLDVVTTDDDGQLVDAAPTLAVERPDGTTTPLVVEHVDAGRYRAVYVTAAAGRHVASASSATAGAAATAAYVVTATTAAGLPTASDVVAYMGASSWTVDQIDDALAAELDAQRAVCRVGAYYGADLRNALLRRVQRNLTMRRLPLALLQGDAGAGEASTMPPGRDPEVRRLEGPYRKVVIG